MRVINTLSPHHKMHNKIITKTTLGSDFVMALKIHAIHKNGLDHNKIKISQIFVTFLLRFCYGKNPVFIGIFSIS